MLKEITKKVAKKLKWTLKTANGAVSIFLADEYAFSESEMIEVLNICLDKSLPKNRSSEVFKFLISKIKKDQVAEVCSKVILGIEPCLLVLAFFNTHEYSTKKLKKNEKEFFKILLHNKNQRLLVTNPLIPEQVSDLYLDFDYIKNYEKLNYKEVDQNIILYTSAEKLSYRFVDELLRYFFQIEQKGEFMENRPWKFDEILDPNDILIPIVKKVGYRVFNIEMYRYFFNLETENAYFSPDFPFYQFSNEVRHVLKGDNLTKKETTERRYWFYYALVKLLNKNYNYKIDPACDKAAELIGDNKISETIRRRYFDKKKEIEKDKINMKFKVPDPDYVSLVAKKYYLRLPLKECIKKLEAERLK